MMRSRSALWIARSSTALDYSRRCAPGMATRHCSTGISSECNDRHKSLDCRSSIRSCQTPEPSPSWLRQAAILCRRNRTLACASRSRAGSHRRLHRARYSGCQPPPCPPRLPPAARSSRARLKFRGAILWRGTRRSITGANASHTSAQQAGDDDVLCLTSDRIICETSRSNIFLVKGERLETPALAGPLLRGIMRGLVIERARILGLEVVEELLPVERIEAADEAFLTNSVRGVVPVERLMEFGFSAPGPITQWLWKDIRGWLESRGAG